MFDFKRFGKVTVCLLCCLACLIVAIPASAVSTITVGTTSSTVTKAPAVSLDKLDSQSSGHLASKIHYYANIYSLVIGCIENGTKITILADYDSFYKVDCHDMTGFIVKSHVAVNEAGEYYVNTVEGSNEATYLPSYSPQEAMVLREKLIETSKKYIGVRYVYGGMSPRWGFDCSGYIQYIFREIGIDISRVVTTQLADGMIVAREDLQPGDLIIFSHTSGEYNFACHIGLYLGNDQLIHCGETRGVTIVNLSDPYYSSHFECARRVILSDVSVETSMPTVNTITGSVSSGWRSE